MHFLFAYDSSIRVWNDGDQKVQQENQERENLNNPEKPNEKDHDLGVGFALVLHLLPVLVSWGRLVANGVSEWLNEVSLEGWELRVFIVLPRLSVVQLIADYLVNQAEVDQYPYIEDQEDEQLKEAVGDQLHQRSELPENSHKKQYLVHGAQQQGNLKHQCEGGKWLVHVIRILLFQHLEAGGSLERGLVEGHICRAVVNDCANKLQDLEEVPEIL